MFGGEYVTIDQDTANHMDTYFCEIDEKLQGAIQNSGYDYKRYSQLYLQLGLKNIFVFLVINIDEILNETKTLNPRKPCSPDYIQAKMIKLCPIIFAENVCLVYSKAIEIGKYSMVLKAIALFKKGWRSNHTIIVPLIHHIASTKYWETIL